MFTDRLFLFVLFFLVNKPQSGGRGGDDDDGGEMADASGVAVDVI